MKKTSLYIDEDLDARLSDAAARERVSKAEYIRRALEAAVGEPPRLVGRGVGKGGPPDLASNVDKYLEGFGDWRR